KVPFFRLRSHPDRRTGQPMAVRIRTILLIALALALSPAVIPAAAEEERVRLAPGFGRSVARLWDEQLLAAIRLDIPKPPAHARNLYHLSVVMWDAWAAYSPTAIGVLVKEKLRAEDVEAARAEAISYAAYRLLKDRFPPGYFDIDNNPCHPKAEVSQAA